MNLPAAVKIVEVGPRDGLQNELQFLPTAVKIEFINRLSAAGYQAIEVTSLVSAKWIPQLADGAEVFQRIHKLPQISYPVLVPNMQGFNTARALGVKEIALFTAASNTFTHKNINCSIEESFKRFQPVVAAAQQANIRVRGYVSCVIDCPYEGRIAAQQVALIAARLYELGCYEISLGDTIGTATPAAVQEMITEVAKRIPLNCLAAHFHDTYGQALANIFAVLQLGVRIFDSSVSGLGGCPYAKGASGNVATEDLLYMLNGLDIATGIDSAKVIAAGIFISEQLAKPSRSKVTLAVQAKATAQ